MDIKFIRDDQAIEREKAFKKIRELIEEKQIPKDVLFAKRFIYSLFYSSLSLEREREFAKHIKFKPEVRSQPIIKEHIIKKIKELKPKPKEIRKKESIPISYPLLVSQDRILAKALIEKDETGRLKYKLIEPEINFEALSKVKELIKGKFRKDHNILSDNRYLLKNIKKAYKKSKINYSEDDFYKMKYCLYRDLMHFGKIDPFMHDPSLSEITCNGLNKPVVVRHDKFGVLETDVVFTDPKELDFLIYKFAKATNEEVSKKKPDLNVSFRHFRIVAVLGHEEIHSHFTIKREA
jgi:hypothetical protein